MERLTSYESDCKREMICRYEDCDTCEDNCPILNEDNCPCLQEILEKLAEYEDLEEGGKLLKLPCAVGDTVYYITPKRRDYEELKVMFFNVFSENEIYMKCDSVKSPYMNYGEIDVDEIGKTVFLTKSAAEQALKEMEGKNGN